MAKSRPKSVVDADRIDQADAWFREADKDIENPRDGTHGRLDADVWFLGMEEAGGGEDNIRTRLNFRPVEYNAEAHKMLGVTHLHWGRRKIQRTWRGMCYIMLRLEGKEPTRESIRNYQAEKLGRSEGNTLLTELMPIPKPKVNRWGYEELIPQFASREEYYRLVKPRRLSKTFRVGYSC